MAKYDVPAGNNIDMLGEECAEVVQEIFKLKRFGYFGTDKWRSDGNEAPINRMIKELGDVLAITERLIANGEISWQRIQIAIEEKHKKLNELFGCETPDTKLEIFKW